MFGRNKAAQSEKTRPATRKEKMTWDLPICFGIMCVLSIAELGFTVDSFIYLQRTHKWWSNTERARLAFLIFSSVRTIALSAVYMGFHCAQKWFHSMFHTIFVFLSTVFWIISGVLIHQMYGYKECGGVGVIKGGLSECHEIKIIEILAWTIAAVSIVATVPIVLNAIKRRKRQAESSSKTPQSG